jgi:hypothetical protein
VFRLVFFFSQTETCTLHEQCLFLCTDLSFKGNNQANGSAGWVAYKLRVQASSQDVGRRGSRKLQINIVGMVGNKMLERRLSWRAARPNTSSESLIAVPSVLSAVERGSRCLTQLSEAKGLQLTWKAAQLKRAIIFDD